MHVLVVVGLELGETEGGVLVVAGGKVLAVVAVDMGGDGQVDGEMAGEDEAYAEVEILAVGDGFVVAADLLPQPLGEHEGVLVEVVALEDGVEGGAAVRVGPTIVVSADLVDHGAVAAEEVAVGDLAGGGLQVAGQVAQGVLQEDVVVVEAEDILALGGLDAPVADIGWLAGVVGEAHEVALVGPGRGEGGDGAVDGSDGPVGAAVIDDDVLDGDASTGH